MRLLTIIDKLSGLWMDWRMSRAVKNLPPEMRELNLHRVQADTREFEIVMTAPAIVYLADQAAELLQQQNAKNYIQFDMMPRLDRCKPPVRVTVQWAHGESPAAKAARLEDELTTIRALLGGGADTTDGGSDIHYEVKPTSEVDLARLVQSVANQETSPMRLRRTHSLTLLEKILAVTVVSILAVLLTLALRGLAFRDLVVGGFYGAAMTYVLTRPTNYAGDE